MKREPIDPLLCKPITSLPVTREFKAMARANGYKTLREVLQCSIYQLPHKRLSGYRMLRELLDVLQEHELLYLVEEE